MNWLDFMDRCSNDWNLPLPKDNVSLPVSSPGVSLNWSDFMVRCGHEWNWYLPEDEVSRILRYNNRIKMKDIWNKFGRGILKYYADRGNTHYLCSLHLCQ